MGCVEYHHATSFKFAPKKIFKCVSLFGKDKEPFVAEIERGTYKIELWGASGGASIGGRRNEGGLGGYSSGILTLLIRETFYFNIGTQGGDTSNKWPGVGGYNGGADGANDTDNYDCPSGGSGGSTDMRINRTIEGRIIVAGGGGSGGCYLKGGSGGHGGGISGIKGIDNTDNQATGGAPGTQTSGYQYLYGEKGISGGEAGGSGGGGYWGGKAGHATNNGSGGAGGGGGSSYISGHKNCSIIEPYHFTNAETIAGNNLMPSNLNPHEFFIGNKGNGAIRITSLYTIETCIQKYSHLFNFYTLYNLFLLKNFL